MATTRDTRVPLTWPCCSNCRIYGGPEPPTFTYELLETEELQSPDPGAGVQDGAGGAHVGRQLLLRTVIRNSPGTHHEELVQRIGEGARAYFTTAGLTGMPQRGNKSSGLGSAICGATNPMLCAELCTLATAECASTHPCIAGLCAEVMNGKVYLTADAEGTSFVTEVPVMELPLQRPEVEEVVVLDMPAGNATEAVLVNSAAAASTADADTKVDLRLPGITFAVIDDDQRTANLIIKKQVERKLGAECSVAVCPHLLTGCTH